MIDDRHPSSRAVEIDQLIDLELEAAIEDGQLIEPIDDPDDHDRRQHRGTITRHGDGQL